MIKTLLQVILSGASIFTNERANYYRKKATDLYKTIEEVEDSEFYSKDMEAKGKAEREIERNAMELGNEYIKESSEASK